MGTVARRWIPSILGCGALALVAPAATTGSLAPAVVPQERALYADGPSGRYLLADGWSTRADYGGMGDREHWERPGADAGFTPVSVPSAFNAHRMDAAGFRGWVQWYRTRFKLPDDERVAGWRVRFEAVGVGATVFVDGARVGSHRGPFLPFEVRADGLRPGEHELVVRVDGRPGPADLPPSTRRLGWWNFAGILREVYLRSVGAFDIESVDVRTRIGDPAQVDVTAMVRNASGREAPIALRSVELAGPGADTPARDVGVTLSAPVNAAPGALQEVNAHLTIPRSRLWSPADPQLYRLRLAVPGGQTWTVHVGLRQWGRDSRGRLLLNDRPLMLRGASFHEQVPGRGAALTPDDRGRIVAQLKALGANATRAHYPVHPALLEAFDQAGIVVWAQAPVSRLTGPQLRAGPLRGAALTALREMVLRDRAHASIMAWSVENETQPPARGHPSYLQAAVSLVRGLDRSRLVAADATLPTEAFPKAFTALDAIGVNEYLGWYSGHTSAVRGALHRVHARFGHQVLVVTEFGAEAARPGPAGRRGTYGFQRQFVASQLAVMDRVPYLSGALIWALRDFAVRPGWSGGNPRPDPPFNRKGLFDLGGRPKPVVATVRDRFHKALRKAAALR